MNCEHSLLARRKRGLVEICDDCGEQFEPDGDGPED